MRILYVCIKKSRVWLCAGGAVGTLARLALATRRVGGSTVTDRANRARAPVGVRWWPGGRCRAHGSRAHLGTLGHGRGAHLDAGRVYGHWHSAFLLGNAYI